MFGQQARHVKTMIDKQPMPGACDTTKQRIETDGVVHRHPEGADVASRNPIRSGRVAADGCVDQITATPQRRPGSASGSRSRYTTTIIGRRRQAVGCVDGGHRVRR